MLRGFHTKQKAWLTLMSNALQAKLLCLRAQLQSCSNNCNVQGFESPQTSDLPWDLMVFKTFQSFQRQILVVCPRLLCYYSQVTYYVVTMAGTLQVTLDQTGLGTSGSTLPRHNRNTGMGSRKFNQNWRVKKSINFAFL